MKTAEVTAPLKVYPGYLHFSLAALAPGTEAPCSIYLETYNQTTKRLRLTRVLAPGAEISARNLDKYLGAGITLGYTALDDLPELQAYFHRITQELLTSSDADPEKGQRLVYENALCSMKAAMLDPRNGRRLSLGAATVRQTLDMIWDDEVTRKGLLRVMGRDRQIYTHSLNVCLLGVGFARSQGWSRPECESLGIALFFHDLGLVEFDNASPENLCYPSIQEAEEFRRHPQASHDYLRQVRGLADDTLETVLNHHENLDGSGFPRGLAASDLGPADRLARIAEVYEGGTSGCLEADAASPYDTLQRMRHEMSAQLDQKMLGSFVRFLGQT